MHKRGGSGSNWCEADSDPDPDPAYHTECSICLDTLAPADELALSCGHSFHRSCITALRTIGVSQQCPLCRAPLPPPQQRFRNLLVALGRLQGHAGWQGSFRATTKQAAVLVVQSFPVLALVFPQLRVWPSVSVVVCGCVIACTLACGRLALSFEQPLIAD